LGEIWYNRTGQNFVGAFVNSVEIGAADLPIVWSHCSFSESVTKHSNNDIKMGDDARFKFYTLRLMKL
jgi:hypothetical protein